MTVERSNSVTHQAFNTISQSPMLTKASEYGEVGGVQNSNSIRKVNPTFVTASNYNSTPDSFQQYISESHQKLKILDKYSPPVQVIRNETQDGTKLREQIALLSSEAAAYKVKLTELVAEKGRSA
jgi:hypothetical protein